MNGIKERHIRIVGIPVLGTVFAILFCPHFPPQPGEIFKSITFTFVFWQGMYTIISMLRKKYPDVKDTRKRVWRSIVYSYVFLILADIAIRFVFDILYPDISWEIASIPGHWIKNLLIATFIGMIYETYYFYAMWNQATLETEMLRTAKVNSQLEALKNQISPHFLFNSLNTLMAIIPENTDQAVLFTEKLSEVYRYVLQQENKEVVKLRNEINVIEAYIFLHKIRFKDNLSVSIEVPEKCLDEFVAPLTLQILVENVIKHNVISRAKPLEIFIYVDDQQHVVVKNRLQKKNNIEKSTNKGLDNIRKRYRLLTNNEIKVKEDDFFTVSVPLIHVAKG